MHPAGGGRRRAGAAIAAAATCLLGGSPGGEGRPDRPAAGPACQAEAPADDAQETAAFVEAFRRRPPRRRPGAEEVVPLENWGHAYGAPPSPFADLPKAGEE
jgi:hypothetical protein